MLLLLMMMLHGRHFFSAWYHATIHSISSFYMTACVCVYVCMLSSTCRHNGLGIWKSSQMVSRHPLCVSGWVFERASPFRPRLTSFPVVTHTRPSCIASELEFLNHDTPSPCERKYIEDGMAWS
jgi:hypothetical protein